MRPMNSVLNTVIALLCLAIFAVVGASMAYAEDAAQAPDATALDGTTITADRANQDDASGSVKQLVEAVRDGHWKLAAGAALVLLVWVTRWAARKWAVPGGKLAWLTSKWGARILLVVLAVGGGVGQALIGGVPISIDLILAGVETTAAGFLGWEVARPKLEPQAAAALAAKVPT